MCRKREEGKPLGRVNRNKGKEVDGPFRGQMGGRELVARNELCQGTKG